MTEIKATTITEAVSRYRCALHAFMEFFETVDHRIDIATELRRIAEHGEGTNSPFYLATSQLLEDFNGRVKYLLFVHEDEKNDE